MVISGVIATIATTPNAKLITPPASPPAAQRPIVSGRMKLEVKGPLATPPESNAIAVYTGGTKNASPKDSR